MACNKPLTAFITTTAKTKANGKRTISFSPSGDTRPTAIPCGQCMGCRIDKARSWSIRLQHESQFHDRSCFLTLTYAPENIPEGGTLEPKELQDFLKRLRKHCWPKRIRFYAVGEYGGVTDRPHYHAIIFGYDFPDRKLHSSSNGVELYNSRSLSKLWTLGYATTQDAHPAAIRYVAGYVVKKIHGTKNKPREAVDTQTGEIIIREPEFARMSRKPGIGLQWIQRYYKDVYPKGYVTDGTGKKVPAPEYYNKWYEKNHPIEYQKYLEAGLEENFERYQNADNNRRKARETIQASKFNLKRGKL